MQMDSDMAHLTDSPEADEALGYESIEPQTPEEGHVAEEWDGVEADYEDEPQPEPEVEPEAEPEEPKKIFGKYDTIEQAEEGFQNLNTAFGRQSQEVGALRQAVQQLYGILQQTQQQAQAPAQQQGDTSVDPAELWERLADDPQGAIAQIVTPIVEQRVAQERAILGQAMQNMMSPVQQMMQQQQAMQTEKQLEATFSEQIREAASKYPDFGDYAEAMKAAIRQNPHLLMSPNGWDTLYKLAKFEAESTVDAKAKGQAQKKAARLPQTGARVTKQRSQNDELVEAALGPMESRGIWG